MRRREFVKVAAAIASLFVVPFGASAVVLQYPGKEARLPGKITRLRIGLFDTAKLRENNQLARLSGATPTLPDPPDDENNYWAEAIEDGDKFYYRIDGAIVEITEQQFLLVVGNPSLYYFSTALKLHYRIKREKAPSLVLA